MHWAHWIIELPARSTFFIEPLVYGHSTGLSPVAVVASAALWGPVGLVLATPLTVCLVVLGRYVESFKFLEVMLSDRPPLSPADLFYQRMLAGDPDEAGEKAEEFLKQRSLLMHCSPRDMFCCPPGHTFTFFSDPQTPTRPADGPGQHSASAFAGKFGQGIMDGVRLT